MAIPLLKVILIRVGTLCLGLFYASLMILANLVRRAINGSEFFEVKERRIPPKCLTDAQYGRHSFIKLKDVKLHYVENGDRSKPLMLFVHGFPEFWFSWRHQMKHFASTHWVVAIDMRGYGDSDKPGKRSDYKIEKLVQDVVDVVHGLNRDSCILVCHDWGGVVGWGVTAHFPKVVSKLIVMNCPHPATFGKKLTSSVGQFLKSWYIFLFQVPWIAEWVISVNDLGMFNRIFIDGNKKQNVTPDELEAFKYTFSGRGAFTPPINYYRQNIPLFLANDESAPFPLIQTPTLFIWGENDHALSRDFPELAKPFVPNLTIKYIPKGDHFIQQDKPAEVNAIMREFL